MEKHTSAWRLRRAAHAQSRRATGVGAAVMLAAFSFGTAGSASASTAICSGQCHWEVLEAPGGMALDVKGQVAGQGTPIIAYRATVGDPAADFTAGFDPLAGTLELQYTPYGTLANAEKIATGSSLAQAKAAYNGDARPRYCVSVTSPVAGTQATLYPCDPTNSLPPGLIQQLTPGLNYKSGYVEFQTSAPNGGGKLMALNDKAYGGDGSPIIDWPSGNEPNELFTPAVSSSS
jgi:hypothetical protein